MNKRGQEYNVAVAIEYVLLILIAVMLATAIYKAPHEERINKLKATDLSLALETISSMKGNVFLDYDVGNGMSVGVENGKLRMYQKSEYKAAEEIFFRNSNYNYEELLERKYDDLFIYKEEGVIRVSGQFVENE